jgi:transposase
MTKPLSIDLRQRLVSAVDGGMSRRSAAARFGVAVSTAIKWVDQWRRTGDVRPRPQGGDYRSQRIEAHAGEILALIEARPDITLGEIALHLGETHGLRVAQSTVWRLLDRHGITFKKNRARQRTATP